MYYYKIMKNGAVESLQNSPALVPDSEEVIRISEEEYLQLTEEWKQAVQSLEEQETDGQSKDEKIAALEAENAALLYQLLTGEEFTDV